MISYRQIQQITALIFLIAFTGDKIHADSVDIPEGRWREKKGTAELITASNNLLFRNADTEEFVKYPVEVAGRVRNEYWLVFSGKKHILESDKALLIYLKYTLEVMFFSDGKLIKKYTFEK